VAKAVKGGKTESARRNMPSRRSFFERTPSQADLDRLKNDLNALEFDEPGGLSGE
jgi:hypothetical protein